MIFSRYIHLFIFLCIISPKLFSSEIIGKDLQPRLLILGDSLSAAHNIPIESGWAKLLQNHFNENRIKWRVVNASISGETTSGGLARLPKLIQEHKPKLCILELGANDGLRGQPLDNMKSNLSSMIKLCQKNAKILLLGIYLPPNYGKKYTNQFKQVYLDLNESFSLNFIPFFLDGIAGEGALMQSDELHPNAEAQPIILSNILPVLLPILNEIDK